MEFSCGGFALGVTWNHGVADGAGMAQFLQAVGELATGMPSPSVAPARWDDTVPSLPPSVLQAQEHLLSMDPVNCKNVGAKRGYYGNCIVEQLVLTTN